MDQPAHILVLHEEPTVRELCRNVLSEEGHTVEAAGAGADGLVKASPGNYDLVVLGLSGAPSGAKEIKVAEPLAVIVGVSDCEALEGAPEVETGIYECLSRAFTPRELIAAVGRGLEARRLRLRVRGLEAENEEVRKDVFRFTTKVAHELRAPLAAIESYLTAYLTNAAGPDPELNRRMLERARGRSHALIELVGDLLEFTRLESGGPPKRKSVLDLSRVITDSVELFRAQGEERSIRIETDLADPLPPVEANQSEMEQLLANLISNAVKYNREGGTVTIRARGEGGFLRISVIDTGIGIAEEDLPHVFDEFSRVSRPETRYTMGTGLGLAITRKIVEAMSGRIEVKSRIDEGTTITVDLPVARRDEDVGY